MRNKVDDSNLVYQGSRARDKLNVIAIKDNLILDLLRPQDGHTVKHVNFPYLFKEREILSAFHR
jgi:hypothetical protein